MTKIKVVFTGVIVVASVIASLLIQRRAQARHRENLTLLQQQDNHLAALAAENDRLSNLLAQTELLVQAKTNSAPPNDWTAELAQLRARVGALRQEADQLGRQVAEKRLLAGTQFYSQGDFDLLDHNHESAITFAGGPRATGKLNDARAITAALRKFAVEHQGEFPLGLEPAGLDLPKPLETNSPPWANAPLTGTNDFEMVYQGSQNDLSNIPPRRVALIRERRPWLTPDGKWARVYGYADGAASIVESDDNFQSWEAQHLIPRRTAGE